MQDKISASIVIYKNDLSTLQQAVDSFLNSTENSILYLIDNSPTNDLEKHFKQSRIKYIFNNKNIGFGAAHNIALKHTLTSPEIIYHIVLNPDVFFDSKVIKNLFQFMESTPEAGLVMPKVLYPDGRLQPVCKLLPSPFTLIARRFLRFFPRLKDLNHKYEMQFTGYNKVMDVPFLSGCFMFLRTAALKEVGLFDERIFLYTEDTDLTRRIHKIYRTVFFPDVSIYHYHQKASYKKFSILYYHISSAITYFNKWGWFKDTERKFINARILINLM